MLTWEMLHPKMTLEHIGKIPFWLDDVNPLSANEQINQNYWHGGGWVPFLGFNMDPKTLALLYPGDTSMRPLAKTQIRDETIVFYDHSWVAIIQKDGSFEVARID